jgi:hypothetical protein
MTRAPILAGWCCIAIAGGGTALEAANNEGRRSAPMAGHFSVEMPNDLVLKDVSLPATDYAMYQVVTKQAKVLLVLYAGNFSGFPTLAWPRVAIESREEGKTTREFPFDAARGWMEGEICFSGLTYQHLPSPYTCVHYSAVDINAEQAVELSRIIKSIKVAKAHLD